MDNGTKLRILYLYQHLVRNTDPEHTLSTAQLMKILKEEYNLKVSRNTISDDLVMLHDCGLKIDHYPSTQNKYYFSGQLFQVPELKMLIDAISASKFITQRQSDELIAKLLTLTSADNALKLHRHIYPAGLIKPDNECNYAIVDAMNTAIDLRKKVTFLYTDYDINRNRYISNEGKKYTFSPYTLTWDGDYYYVRGWCDERNHMRTFRLDRIADTPTILDDIAVMAPTGYSPVEYSKAVFRMLDTDEPEQVDLYCHKSVMKYIIDNFGNQLDTEPINEDYFTARIQVCTSATFYRWVFGFGDKIKILAPDTVIADYKKQLKEILETYNE